MSLLWRGEEEKGGPIGDSVTTSIPIYFNRYFEKCTRGHAFIYELVVTIFQGSCQPSGLPKGKRCHRWISFSSIWALYWSSFVSSSNFHKLFSFNYSGMVGSTGVNGTDDSDELMRKLRALWNYQKKRVAIFLGVCWYLFRYLQMWHWLILLRISTDARIHFVMMVSPLISWDVYVISVQTNTCIWTWDM